MASGRNYFKCNMDKGLYLVARALHQHIAWLKLEDIQRLLKNEGFNLSYASVNGYCCKLYKEKLASKFRIPTGHGATALYKWHSYVLDDPDELEFFYEPIPQQDITLEVQLLGDEKERYSLIKDRKDAFYCGLRNDQIES